MALTPEERSEIARQRAIKMWANPEYRKKHEEERKRRYLPNGKAAQELIKQLTKVNENYRKARAVAASIAKGEERRGGEVPPPYAEIYQILRKVFRAKNSYKILNILRKINEGR